MTRQKVAAIIIKNKKILLVRDSVMDFFILPGGALEKNEDHDTAIARELKEEIKCTIKKSDYYFSFDSPNQRYNVPQTNHAYFVSINEEPICSTEICELGWFSGDDIANGKVKVPPASYQKLYTKLINENFL